MVANNQTRRFSFHAFHFHDLPRNETDTITQIGIGAIGQASYTAADCTIQQKLKPVDDKHTAFVWTNTTAGDLAGTSLGFQQFHQAEIIQRGLSGLLLHHPSPEEMVRWMQVNTSPKIPGLRTKSPSLSPSSHRLLRCQDYSWPCSYSTSLDCWPWPP